MVEHLNKIRARLFSHSIKFRNFLFDEKFLSIFNLRPRLQRGIVQRLRNLLSFSAKASLRFNAILWSVERHVEVFIVPHANCCLKSWVQTLLAFTSSLFAKFILSWMIRELQIKIEFTFRFPSGKTCRKFFLNELVNRMKRRKKSALLVEHKWNWVKALHFLLKKKTFKWKNSNSPISFL
jgi:hypothetical protein